MLREFNEADPSPVADSAPPTVGRAAWEWLRFLLLLALAGLILRSFVVAPFTIPSRSMTPTLLVGDFLFVAKWPYGYSRYSFPIAPAFIQGRIGDGRPQRGDVIVFRSPADTDVDYVKRVIGLPGDTVRLDHGIVILNGEPLSRTRIADFLEPANLDGACPDALFGENRAEADAEGNAVCRTARYRETLPSGRSYAVLDAGPTMADDTKDYAVPEGRYFLLGDDRDRSADSRFAPLPGGGVGLVPEEDLVGRALVVFWSSDGSASWGYPSSWFSAARWARIGETF